MAGNMTKARFFADLELARRVETAWDYLGVENAQAQMRRLPDSGTAVLALGGGHAVFMGAGSPLSQAQGLGLYGEVARDQLAKMEEFFQARGTPTQIEVASLAEPSLLAALSLRGYTIAEQTHALVCPLHDWSPLDNRLPPSSDGTLEVDCIDAGGLEEWVDVLLRCFFESPDAAPPTLREGAISMGSVPGNTVWLAKVDGRPAGGGSLMIHDGLALICGDGTLPGYRHRGIQTSLLRARLDHVQKAGCDLAAICTQPGSGSQRNAERQGFQVVYARTMMIHQ
jgi:hypothetical protein